jgi:hypothetical protein
MSGERVVSYDTFMSILADGKALGLCNAPDPETIKSLGPGADVVLSLEEMGCGFVEHRLPYHHRVRAVVLYERTAHIVDMRDAVWRTLPTIEEWIASLPLMILPESVIQELDADDGDHDGEEDGGSGVREPRPDPAPSDDMGASIPHEVPVG